LNEQPTPQYAQVVVATRSGRPIATTDFSVNATVGQASTQAPHDTHSDAKNDSFWLAETLELNPRPWMVSANVPWTSSHARTHLEQTMHIVGSKLK
jgi:hypothetical protein